MVHYTTGLVSLKYTTLNDRKTGNVNFPVYIDRYSDIVISFSEKNLESSLFLNISFDFRIISNLHVKI